MGYMAFDLPRVEPNSDIETLFKAVGFVVVQWGLAEQSLDLIVANIFHSFNGHHLLKRRLQNLEPKIKFIRDCFSEIPELKSFSAEGNALLTRFSAAGKKRNDIVHSAIASLSIEDGSFRFLKIDVLPKEHHSVREVLLEDSDWKSFRKELLRLGKDGQHLAQNICSSTNQGRS